MGRILEFALATTMIITIQLSFTFWAATTIGNRITELFETIIVALSF